jgi:hypothetical protein
MNTEIVPTSTWSRGDAVVNAFRASGSNEYEPLMQLVTLVDHRRAHTYFTEVGATSLRLVKIHTEREPSGGFAIEALSDWTGLSNDRLAYALAASRRSLYNWRHGAQVGADAQERIKRTYRILRSLITTQPGEVRSWLELGEPPAIELMHRGEWQELEERVAKQLNPPTARRLDDDASFIGEPDVFGAETRTLMLHAFASPRTEMRSRPGWSPREVTGLGEVEQEDE